MKIIMTAGIKTVAISKSFSDIDHHSLSKWRPYHSKTFALKGAKPVLIISIYITTISA